jgi:hypothetical protein
MAGDGSIQTCRVEAAIRRHQGRATSQPQDIPPIMSSAAAEIA